MLLAGLVRSQEFIAPLSGNMNLIYREPTTVIPDQQAKAAHSVKTQTAALADSLPFFDDFYYASWSPFPSSKYWTDSSVYVNTGFAIAPPSIGVATFDGLNKLGYPYQMNAGPAISISADTLTSKPINFHKFLGTGIYQPSDSIGFTFLYQSAGFGENPEVSDSLVVEFYKPLAAKMSGTTQVGTGVWNMVWSTRGVAFPVQDDSTFRRAFIYITDTAYFHDGFRFRFRNKATPSGSLDHWHVDYVTIDKNLSQKGDTIYTDASFGYVPRPFLKNYSAMPWRQFTSNEMGAKYSNFIRDNNSIPLNVNYKYDVYNAANSIVWSYNGGSGATDNVYPFRDSGWAKGPSLARPVLSNTFAIPTGETFYTIKHFINTTPDKHRDNDTVLQKTFLSNYFAYDDGSAEVAYYLNTTGAKLAQRFTLNASDTLQAMDIFFDPVVEGSLIVNSNFRMMLWADDGNGKPGAQLYRDSLIKPVYLKLGYNKIPRYKFTTPQVMGPGTYYFGIQQQTQQHLNIGFDRNIDHMNALYYNTMGTWTQSAIKGSLMIHPIFGGSQVAIGIKELFHNASGENIATFYPNPANDVLFAVKPNDSQDIYDLEIYSSVGQKLKDLRLNERVSEINTTDLAPGIYFVVLKNENSVVAQQKIIISR